jgi:cellulose biosynthesis protein BcsQ
MAKLLKLYTQRFKYVVIDTPGSRVSIFATLALTAANIAIITCKTEYSHQDATQETMNLIEDIKDGLNTSLVIWGILPTQYESNVKHHQEVLDLIKEDTKDPNGKPYPVYTEPSRKTTRYNDATSMRIDARLLEPTLGPYWDRIAASVIEEASKR